MNATATITPLRRFAGAIAFVVGVLLAGAGLLWRGLAGIHDAPEFIVLAAGGIGWLGYMLLLIGRNLWVGLSFVQATGADETKKTSKVVLVLAGLLFIPFWLISLAMTVKSFGTSSSIQALTIWAFISAFVTLIVFGIIREWRK